MESSTLILLCALVCTVAIALSRFATTDPREPPHVNSKIPVIGHIIGFIRHGQPYLNHLCAARPDLPIFTVNLLVAKFYVVSSPALLSSVQRNHRSLSFEYFINLSASGMLGIKGAAMKLLREEQKGGGGLGMKVTHAMNPALIGDGLDDMNARMITFLKPEIDKLESAQDSHFDLFAWTRHAITVAATESAWGTKNPYRSPELEDAFWTMENNLDKLLFGILPHLTARKVWTARESIVRAFTNYYTSNGLADASAMARARWHEQETAGATLPSRARLETGLGLGLLANTVPAAFWTLFEIYSRPNLLNAIRAELRQHAVHLDEHGVRVVDLADIRDKCELLLSTFQETLRVRSKAMPLRMVYEDVQLGGEYVLKEGAIVHMPSPVFHRNEGIWGDGAGEFDAWRFVKGDGERKEGRRSTGFLAFGFSPSLCPGRHFATGEVLALAAMLVLRFDAVPEGGEWRVPRVDARSAAASFYTPCEEVGVRFKARAGYEGTRWAYRVTPGKGRFGLVVG